MLKKFTKAFLLVMAFISIQASSVNAADSNASGLQLSPTIINLNSIQGNSYVINIKVRNVTANTLAVRSAINQFTNKDETGTPHILAPNEEPEEDAVNFRTWVSIIPKFEVNPKTEKTISATINVPKNASVGGHYGIIRFYGLPPDVPENSNTVALNASVGALVLIKVGNPQDIKEALSLKDLYVSKNNNKARFVESGPITISSRFENTGNVHIKPAGLLTVKSMFGKTIASKPISDNLGNVLPDSIRKFDQTISNKWLFGKYTVTLDATYGSNNTAISKKISFWAIPYKLISIGILALAAAIFGIRKLLKWYTARVIARHNGKN